MSLILFAAPFFSENAKRFLGALLSVEGVRVALVSQDPIELLPGDLRARLRTHVHVGDGLNPEHLAAAGRRVIDDVGELSGMIAIMEQIQVPLAVARAALGVPGMSVGATLNFRDKRRMKDLLRDAGVPVARHRQAPSLDDATGFAAEVGYPVVVKPPAGAASQGTFRADDFASLATGHAAAAKEGGVPLVEEFVTGAEHSFDAFVKGGELLFSSVSRYLPAPLEVVQNPWIQWVVVLPREVDAPAYDAIREAGLKSLRVLGLETGMCHLEWFRRADGSVVVSEVGARPGGAQIPSMISRAHDVDCLGAWAKLVTTGAFTPFPPRKYAVGAAYLRGQGQGRVRAVHGIDAVERDVGHLICDARLPAIGCEKAISYEGDGYIIVRHPETRVVEDALRHVVSTVRVEYA